MPISTLQLISLNTDTATFLWALRTSNLKPLTVARVNRWIITPPILSKESLLSNSSSWGILLILPGSHPSLPANLQSMIRTSWTLRAGVPSKIVDSFDETNSRLLHPSPEQVPMLTRSLSRPWMAESGQALELTAALNDWIHGAHSPKGAISMLNLLAFNEGMKEQYLKYGKAFAESVGSRRGGVAKIVGKVISGSCSDGCNEWEEVCDSVSSCIAFGTNRDPLSARIGPLSEP